MEPGRSLMTYRVSGPLGALGCGGALLCLGLFLLTPLAVILLKGVGWALVALGILVAGLGFWAWLRRK